MIPDWLPTSIGLVMIVFAYFLTLPHSKVLECLFFTSVGSFITVFGLYLSQHLI